ncbi:hypothetical protein F4809DRAFT_646597 [Biscogniauxia mediterranea]|nr:hypothetical protein F4809DRAFT_646597 [Biscogniauxia mediterranea]
MPFFYSKHFGGKHFGTSVHASRHGVHRGPWRFSLGKFNCFRANTHPSSDNTVFAMLGGYSFRQFSKAPYVGPSSSPISQPAVYKIDTLVDSMHDVRAILEYLDHPFILVSDSAADWVQPDKSTNLTVDMLVSTSKLEYLVELLTTVGQWDQPTSMTEDVQAAARPETTSLEMLQRDADVLLQKPQFGDEPSVFLRLWSEDTYQLPISQHSITEARASQGRVYTNPWKHSSDMETDAELLTHCHDTAITSSEYPLTVADKVFIPTLPALMDAVVHQRNHLRETKSLLCSDADGLIERLTEQHSLDMSNTGALLLAAVKPETQDYLKPYFEQFERAPRFTENTVEQSATDRPINSEPREKPVLPSPATSQDSPETKEPAKEKKPQPQPQPRPRGTKRANSSSPDDADAVAADAPRVKRARTDSLDDTPSRVKRTAVAPSQTKRATRSPAQARKEVAIPAKAKRAAAAPAPTSTPTPTPIPAPMPAPEEEPETVMVWRNGHRTRVPLTKGVARPRTPAAKRGKAASSTKNTKNDRVQKWAAPQKKKTTTMSSVAAARSSSSPPQSSPHSSASSATLAAESPAPAPAPAPRRRRAAPPASRPRKAEVMKLFKI